MSKLLDHAIKLAEAFPDGGPVYLNRMAEICWPGAYWLNTRVNRHNGGARCGARVAGGLAGKLERAGYLRMTGTFPQNYQILVDNIRAAAAKAAVEAAAAEVAGSKRKRRGKA